MYRRATSCSKTGHSYPVPSPANRSDSLSCRQICAAPALEFQLLEMRRKELAEIRCVRREHRQQPAPKPRRQRLLPDRARIGHVPESVLAVLGRTLGCALRRGQQCLAQGPGTRGRPHADGDDGCRRASPEGRGCSDEEFRRGCVPEPGPGETGGSDSHPLPEQVPQIEPVKVCGSAADEAGCLRASPEARPRSGSTFHSLIGNEFRQSRPVPGMCSRNSSCNQGCSGAVSGCGTDGARAGLQSGRFFS